MTMIVTAIIAGVSLLISSHITVQSGPASEEARSEERGASEDVVGATSRRPDEDDAVLDDTELLEDSDVVISDSDATTQQTANVTVNTNATVLHVVDGDTLDADLDGIGKVRIRMLGVNTPETVDPRKTVECFGKSASDFSKQTLMVGKRIQLAEDPQADERDKYGRLLRNVILEDGTDFNALLVQEGYAYAYLGFPLDPQRKVQLKRLEIMAKTEKRGLWGADCE